MATWARHDTLGHGIVLLRDSPTPQHATTSMQQLGHGFVRLLPSRCSLGLRCEQHSRIAHNTPRLTFSAYRQAEAHQTPHCCRTTNAAFSLVVIF